MTLIIRLLINAVKLLCPCLADAPAVMCSLKMYLFLYYQLCVWCANHLSLEASRSEFVQEGFTRLWRGTNASLALAVPTVSLS